MQKIFIILSFLFLLALGKNVQAQKCQVTLFYFVHDTTNEYYFEGTTAQWPKYSYKWDFGDGNTSTQQSNIHYTYKKNGTYKVCLYTDSAGCKDTACATIVATKKNPCNAEFTAAPDKSNPLKWNFAAIDTLEDTYDWAWASGTKKYTHTYSSIGTYSMSLWVHNFKDHCRDTVTKKVYVKKCYANFTVSINQGTKTATFTNTSTAGMTNFKWNYGDGKSSGWGTGSSFKNSSHTYSKAGTYWVNLTNYDSIGGCGDSIGMSITIDPCAANFSYNLTDTILDYYAYNPNKYKLRWNFGDGKSSTKDSSKHTYQKPGTYYLCLTVFCSSTDSATDCSTMVASNKCRAGFTASKTGKNKIQFTNSSNGYWYYWIMGDGKGSDTAKNPTYTYSKAGKYWVTLMVYNKSGTCLDSTHIIVTVTGCDADFTATPDPKNNMKYLFKSPYKGIGIKHKWSLDLSKGKDTATIFFKSNGAYTMYHIITDSINGCTDTVWKTIYIGKTKCDSTFTYWVSNDTVYFAYKGSSTKALNWDFGGPYSIDTSKHVTQGFYVYPTYGSYTLCLRAYCNTSSFSVNCVNLNINPKCDANYTYQPDATNKLKINFFNRYPAKTQHKWYFGDGKTSTAENPIYSYSTFKSYNVCHVIYDSIYKKGCKDSVCKTIVVAPSKCDSSFTAFVRNDSLIFSYTGTGAKTLQWDFGDGKMYKGTVTHGEYQYSKPGTYTVCLRAYCSSTDSSQKCVSITIKCKLKLKFDSKLISSRTIEFTDQSSLSKNSNYWSFGDGTYSSSKNPKHTYSTPGLYRVLLYTYDSTTNCGDTVGRLILVTTKGPKCQANFNVVSNTINIMRYSFLSLTDTVGIKHTWIVDGVKYASDTPAMIRTFSKAGIYQVCLIINDTINKCKDTTCTKVGVSSPCNADFVYKPDTKYKINFTSLFNGSSTTKYYWEFGNGKTSTSQNPNLTYDSVGKYTVCLYLNDTATKCKDTVCKTITVTKPECDSIFFHAVKGDSLYFTYQGNAPNLKYNFGDGKTSTSKSGMHIYSKPGTYWVCLTAYCSGDSSKYCDTITIKPKCKALYSIALDTTQKFKLFLINKSSNTSSTQYTWDFGDGSYSGNRNPTHKYSKFGKYVVCLIVVDTAINCSSKYCDNLGLDSNGRLLKAGAWELIVLDEKVFGINKIVKSDFKIYPNPANTKVTVDVSNSSQKYEKIEIINANGQVCIIQALDVGSESMEIDLERLNRGLYLIKLSNDDGYSYAKMMKN